MTKAEKEETFAGRVHKEAIRLFVFSKDCPSYLNPYNYVRNALMDKFVVAANDILAKNEKNNFVSGFTASVVQQIETKGYVSNNQLAQIQRILSENGFLTEEDLSALENDGEKEKAARFEYLESHYDELCSKFELQATENVKAANRAYAAGFHYRRW